MQNNLINTVKSYFSDEVINKLGITLNETPANIQQGLDVGIPSLLLGLQSKNTEGLSGILQSARQLFGNVDFGNVFEKFFGSPSGTDQSKFETQNIVGSIFGERKNGIIDTISAHLGIRSETISGLLGASLPAIISGITNRGTNWDVNSIKSLLNTNKQSFVSSLPTGIGLGAFGSLFAASDTFVPDAEVSDIARDKIVDVNSEEKIVVSPTPHIEKTLNDPPYTHSTKEERKSEGGFWWLLLPLILIGAWLLFGKGCESKSDKVVVNDTSTINNSALENDSMLDNTVDNREYVDVDLPDGQSLKAFKGGIEENLINFLQSDYNALSDDQLKERWFDFDNLNFETGTANVLPESKIQLENIAYILGLFPEAKIKIGGYTDKTGDEGINKRISQARADAVKQYLVDKGLGVQVVDAEGYGSEFATVSADASDEERARDRRVAVSVRK